MGLAGAVNEQFARCVGAAAASGVGARWLQGDRPTSLEMDENSLRRILKMCGPISSQMHAGSFASWLEAHVQQATLLEKVVDPNTPIYVAARLIQRFDMSTLPASYMHANAEPSSLVRMRFRQEQAR